MAGLPPALVVTAEVDPLHDCAEDYVHRMVADGVPAELRRYDGVFHGFFTEVGTLAAADAAVSEAATRIRRALTACRQRTNAYSTTHDTIQPPAIRRHAAQP